MNEPPFYQRRDDPPEFSPAIREDVILSREEALESCWNFILQYARPDDVLWGEVVRRNAARESGDTIR